MLPLTFIVGYQADLAYGTKVNRIRAEAENILQYEHDLTDMPGGLPSLASIDAGRIKVQVKDRELTKISSEIHICAITFTISDRKNPCLFIFEA